MGLVNIRYREGRKSPWRAQWYEQSGDALRPREKWFPGPPPPTDQPDWAPEDVLKFKAQHEGEASTFGEIAMTETDRARWWRIREDCAAAATNPEAVMAAGLTALRKLAKNSEPLETALGLWEIDARARKLRKASIDTMRQTVRAYSKARELTPVSTVTAADLMQWVGARYDDQTSRDDVLGRLLTFFRWCAAPPRNWAQASEFVAVKWPHKVKGDKKRIGFYFAEEARALLAAVADSLKPAIALGFMTGLRPIEMMRVMIEWEKGGEFYGFDEKRGEWHLPPEWTKTRAYRKLYALPDCWWFWWLKYRAAIKPNPRQKSRAGHLVPMNYRNFRRALTAARRAAGIRKNPHDGIRHSFGTHGFHRSADGRERGVEWCIALMGHVGGFRVFESSYNGKVSTAEAEAYWLNYPDGSACDTKTRARLIVAQ